jgi:uncharacterized protein (TIGR02466 family)
MLTPFGWPIFVPDETFEISEDFIKYMEKLPYQENINQGRSSIGSYILDMPKFKELKSFIEKHLNHYFHEILQVDDKLEIYITQSWLNCNPTGVGHPNHSHPNSLLSGTFYVQGEPNTPIIFERRESQTLFGSKTIDLPYKQLNQYNDNRFFVVNELNKIVLFPSHLQHEVIENPNKTTRISLAFNTYVRGTLGYRLHLTELKIGVE